MKYEVKEIIIVTLIASILFHALVGRAEKKWLDVGGSAELSQYEGREVRLMGRTSTTPAQHLIGSVSNKPFDAYFDTVDHGQIVVYSDRPIDCQDKMQIWGKVVRIHGGSELPDGEKKTKMPEEYEEHHLELNGWKCLK